MLRPKRSNKERIATLKSIIACLFVSPQVGRTFTQMTIGMRYQDVTCQKS
jgi:hypothetical protein